jgi:phage tail sheath protein FI
MTTYTYPGVYIQELPSGVHTITGVPTSIVAFIGWAGQGSTTEATLIQSWGDFQTQFGGLDSRSLLGYAVSQFYGIAGAGSTAYVVRLAWTDAGTASASGVGGLLNVTANSPGAWGNNLQIAVAQQAGNLRRFGVQVLQVQNGTTKVLESYANLSMAPSDPLGVANAINSVSQYVTVATIPGPTQPAPPTTATAGGTLPAGTYYYLVTAAFGFQESAPSAEQSVVTTGAASENTITWTAAPNYNGNAPSGYRVYRGTASGQESIVYDVGAGVVTFTDTGGAASTAPSFSTTIAGPTQGAAPTTSASGGSLATGTYHYVVTALFGSLESLASADQQVVTTGPNGSNVVSWTAAPTYNGLAPTAYRVYRGTADSKGNVSYNVYYTPPNPLTFTDTGAAAFNGSPNPSNGAVQLQGGADGTVLSPNDGNFEIAVVNALPLLEPLPIFNLLCVPGENDASTIQNLQQYCNQHRAFYLVDCPKNVTTSYLAENGPAGTTSGSLNANSGLAGQFSINSAYYYPWVYAADPLAGNRPTLFPPSGFVAGVYAATDASRNVWKAPAGIDASLSGTTGLQTVLSDAQNGLLNPQGINCLRQFKVYGNVVWGARTLNGDDQIGSQWKYVPIRRLALFLESSLYDGTQWVVFEPNDENLWGQIRLNVGTFMQGLFLQGAFQGVTPSQAYFVKCDSENNPQASIDLGVVNILVGFAPLYPAEFVVVQIQQMAGQLQS